jgi:phosphoribosyl 1,2-cyclic phosphodiesterase
VRYGGNTACVSVRPEGGGLIVLDCGTGARNLGISLMEGAFGKGAGEASILLSHAHWDHIQGFPFFVPLYQPGNRFRIYGGAESSSMLEGILEGQMAPQYFPVQTLKNMGASIDIVAIAEGKAFEVERCQVRARTNPHGRAGALAFRIDDGARSVVYASDAGYLAGGPPAESLDLYRGADVLIHDSTYTPEDQRRYADRGLDVVEEAENLVDPLFQKLARRALGFATELRCFALERFNRSRCARLCLRLKALLSLFHATPSLAGV